MSETGPGQGGPDFTKPSDPNVGWSAPPPPGPPPGGYPPPQGGWAPGPQPGWGPPGPYGGAYQGWGYPPPEPPKTSGKAVAVLVLGISSLIACIGIPGIVALFLAPGAKREIAASQGRLTGDGLVKAGVICSWISVAILILAVVIFVAVIALVATSSGSGIEIQTPSQPALEF